MDAIALLGGGGRGTSADLLHALFSVGYVQLLVDFDSEKTRILPLGRWWPPETALSSF